MDEVGIFAKALTSSFHPEEAALWLDFEQETENGTFYSYGIGARTYGSIWYDRSVQPEMWQMKKTGQPLSFSMSDVTEESLSYGIAIIIQMLPDMPYDGN